MAAAAISAAGIATNFGHELSKRFRERASAFVEKTWGLDKNEHIRRGIRRAQIAATQETLRLWRVNLPHYDASADDHSHHLARLLTAWCDEQEKDSVIEHWTHAARDPNDEGTLRQAFETAFGAEIDKRAGMAERARQARKLATEEAFEDAIDGALAPGRAHPDRAAAIRASQGLDSLRQAVFREGGGGWFDLFLRAIGREFKDKAEFKRLWDSVQLGGISAMLLDDIKLNADQHQELTRFFKSEGDQLVGIQEAVEGLSQRMDARFDEVLRVVGDLEIDRPPLTAGRSPDVSDQPTDAEAFSIAVGEGVLMTIRGRVVLTQQFLRNASDQCRGPHLVAEITAVNQDLNDKESLVGKLMSHLVIPNLRSKNWSVDELQRVVDEAGRHIHGILLRKAHEVGIMKTTDDETYLVDDNAFDSHVYTVVGRLSYPITKDMICRQIYESWKDVITTAIESIPGENKPYINILSLFMYSISYDNGSVLYCSEVCEKWQSPQSRF